MLSVEHKHPDVFKKFQSGKFVVFKSSRTFSAMVIDQAHEQANVVIKGEGGAIGMAEDPSALKRWMVTEPEVSRLATQYEMSLVVRKSVFGVSDQVPHKPGCTATQDGLRLEISYLGSKEIVLSM